MTVLSLHWDSSQHQRLLEFTAALRLGDCFYMAMTGADLQKTLHELGNLLKSRSISSWNVERSAERKRMSELKQINRMACSCLKNPIMDTAEHMLT